MSRQDASSRRRAQGDSEYVTNWSALLAAGAVGIVFVAGFVGVVMFDSSPTNFPRTHARLANTGTFAEQECTDAGRFAIKSPHFRRNTPTASWPPKFVAEEIATRRPAVATTMHLASAWRAVAGDALALQAASVRDWAGAIEMDLTNPSSERGMTIVQPPPAAATHAASESIDYEQSKPKDPLLNYLVHDVRELKLDDVKDTSTALFESTKSTGHSGFEEHSVLLHNLAYERADLRGLPLLDGSDCTSETETAAKRGELSLQLRRAFGLGGEIRDLDLYRRKLVADKLKSQSQAKTIDELQSDSPSSDTDVTFDELARWLLDSISKSSRNWNDPAQAAILQQMFQCESVPYRRLMVNWLAKIDGPEASAALARRAVFDFDAVERTEACRELHKRPAGEYESVLQTGLKYPFAPVARNASRALEFTQAPPDSRRAQGESNAATSQPSPTDPGAESSTNSTYSRELASFDKHEDIFYGEWSIRQQNNDAPDVAALLANNSHVSMPYYSDDDAWVIDELVKVNHLRSCVMCHPGSNSTSDPLRGQIPTPGQPLPQVYYSSSKGNFVRADVVYIRQDFSVMLPVEDAKPWPPMQRYDFFLRTRPATEAEMAESQAQQLHSDAVARRKFVQEVKTAVADLGEEAKRVFRACSRRAT